MNIDEGFIRGDKICKKNWRDFFNQKAFVASPLPKAMRVIAYKRERYTVAYVDFFDEEVKARNGDWKSVLEEYLYATSEPIINGFAGGREFLLQKFERLLMYELVGHPFIHLAYAYEFQSKEVATEALSLGCTELLELHGLIAHNPPDNSTYKTKSLADVIAQVRTDPRFDGLLTVPGITNFEAILKSNFSTVMEHWNAWEVVDPTQQLEQCIDLSVLLAISDGDPEKSYDFYNVHLMTVAHALRILWQYFPTERRASILKQYALFTILIYIAQLRPKYGIENIESVKTDSHDWDWVVQTALTHKWALDSHFFKVVRAPKAFAEAFGEKNGFYLKAAVKFVTEFRGWEGFGLGVEGFLPSRDGYIPE